MTIKLRVVSCAAILMLPFLAASAGGERLGLGRSVQQAEIDRWDNDVRPDGKGLPAGRGNVTEGEKVYALHCLHCHGEGGEGGINDRLVGRIPGDAFPFGTDPGKVKTIGNYWPYSSTLFDYIRRAMPYASPGILSSDEIYSVTAYLLFLNRIIDHDTEINAVTLPQVRMPARDRFVIDDRTKSEAFLSPIDRKKP